MHDNSDMATMATILFQTPVISDNTLAFFRPIQLHHGLFLVEHRMIRFLFGILG